MTTHDEKLWYIFRHGLATHSKTGYGDRILTAEVLPEGIPPIRRLGTYLLHMPYDSGYRSELIRCQQTAAIVTEITGHPFTADPRLNEQIDEPYTRVLERVQNFLDEVSETPHRHIWVCTHGAIIAALKHLLTREAHTPVNQNDYTQPGELLIIRERQSEVVRFGSGETTYV